MAVEIVGLEGVIRRVVREEVVKALGDLLDAHRPRDDALMTPRDAAGLLGVSVDTLRLWRIRGGGPPFVKIGGAVRYRRSDLTEWIAARERRSTSDEPERR